MKSTSYTEKGEESKPTWLYIRKTKGRKEKVDKLQRKLMAHQDQWNNKRQK